MTDEREHLRKLAHGTLRLMQEFKKAQDMRTDLDRVAFEILMLVKTRGRVRKSDIAGELDFNPSSITRRIQTLAASGHVSVTADPADLRSSLVGITPRGEDQLMSFLERSVDGLSGILSGWDADELQELSDKLWHYADAMRDWRTAKTKPVHGGGETQ